MVLLEVSKTLDVREALPQISDDGGLLFPYWMRIASNTVEGFPVYLLSNILEDDIL